MANEYRQSLQKYQALVKEEEGLWKQWCGSEGRGVPNEDIIAFMNHVGESWSLMYALEQRQFCREKMHNWLSILNGQRNSSVLRVADNYQGILGEPATTEGLFNEDPLDYRVHEGQRVWILDELEKMADAVDAQEKQK